MGAGRKTQTIIVKEKSLPPWTANGSDTARNLRTTDLAAVIFGCKYSTFEECFSNNLFGLPSPHYAYVKNIYPGMPLFLFNYSDRKLHGIFEAASHGRLNINSQAWTEDGSDSSPYAAQVKFRIRIQCQPLVEDQFSPILAENYYASKLFWFELDKDQTKKLISLFSSLPMAQRQNMLLRGSCGSNAREKQRLQGQIDDKGMVKERDSECVKPSSGISYLAIVKNKSSSHVRMDQSVVQLTNHNETCSSTIVGSGTSLSQKPWSALFSKETITEDTRRETEDFKVPSSISDVAYTDQYGLQPETLPYPNQNHVLESPMDKEDTKSCGTVASLDMRQESQVLNLPEDCFNSEWSSSCVSPSLLEESEPPRDPIDGNMLYNESNCESMYEAMANMVITEDNQREVTVTRSKEPYAFGPNPLDFDSILAKLLLEVEGLKGSHSMQAQKINCLEQELVESRIEMEQLKDRCKMLELRHLNADGLLLIAGGYDGSLWLSGLDSYSPFQDLKTPLASMNFARSHASAANLDGELYVFGGVHGDLWYDTAESYNPANNQWVSRPSLSRRRGHLAGVSLNNKIFAIGGGNESDCLSEVEMLDVNAAKWIPVRSMLEKRFAPAAAEMSGVLYVAGGYNEGGYLHSVERFDPRDHSWIRLKSMTTKRGWHSLAVLNEKLYALGGYDGRDMVSTVEVFDPRVGSWMMEGSMSLARGYFGAVVMRDSIYVIGGLTHKGAVLDTVECYKPGVGWKATGLQGVGKRCFYCASVL